MAYVKLRADHFLKPPSYIISVKPVEKGRVYKALNCETQAVEFSGVDAVEVIQKAIDALPAEGGRILIKRGRYEYGASIKPRDGCVIEGEGPHSTLFVPVADVPFLEILDKTRVQVKNLRVDDEQRITTGWAIEVDCLSYFLFESLELWNPYNGIQLRSTLNIGNTTREGTFRTIRILNVRRRGLEVQKDVHDICYDDIFITGVSGSEHGLWMDSAVGGIPGIWICGGNKFSNISVLGMGGIGIYLLNRIESWFTNIVVDGCGMSGIVIENNVTFPPHTNRLFLTNVWSSSNGDNGFTIFGIAGQWVRDVYIRNAYAWLNNVRGLLCDRYVEQCRLELSVYRNGSDGAMLKRGRNNRLRVFAMENSEIETDRHGVVLEDETETIVEAVARDFRPAGEKRQAYGIFEVGTSDYNLIVNSDVRDNKIGPVALVGPNTRVVNTRGYVTRNSGVATLPAGATSVTVAHGLAATPRVVKATPRSTAVGAWAVTARNGTNFTITVETAPATDVDIDWEAEL